MGSGLILLVIVGAWLAVLVPMALRSYESTSTRSVERFGDAMRVLSRRAGRATAGEGADPWDDRADDRAGDHSGAGVRTVRAPSRLAADLLEPVPPVEPLLHRFRDDPPRAPLTLVQRRRRVLLSLLAAAAVALLAGLLTAWALVAGVVLLGAAVAYVVHLRRLEVAKAERLVRAAGRAPARRPAPAAAPVTVPASRPEPAPAAPWEDPLPAVANGDWSPVPVPPPVYVGKPIAPPRAPRAIDLDEADRWADAPAATDEDRELDDILDGRRAVGGW